MKYLKSYENKIEYNVGDYILVEKTFLDKSKNYIYYAKIISINTEAHFPIRIVDEKNNEGSTQPPNIIRKLTEEEIENYKTKIEADKYNL